MSEYQYKINTILKKDISEIKNPQILEFGVKEGRSTKLFLEICKENDGKLFSVDIDDYSHLFKDKNWKFIKTRDDNFDHLDKILPGEIDVIYLDSLHEAEHVKKIFYHYFPKLKLNGLFFIDDISWLPYGKNKKRNSFYCEINNFETFHKLLEIYISNTNNFDINFTFISSGMCKIRKKSNQLNIPGKIKTRLFSLKNLMRKILK